MNRMQSGFSNVDLDFPYVLWAVARPADKAETL